MAEAGVVHPINRLSAEFVAHMERTCWTCTPNPMTQSGRWSCFDETSTQLLAEISALEFRADPPKPTARAGTPPVPNRQDYEYRREGRLD